ncbi:MAG TPA: glycosyltransferase family 87 protein [Verrucomicrobiae bacterium]|nr:glycosyltransferase family 87 protein [Verrucomicrobiae bacterium]
MKLTSESDRRGWRACLLDGLALALVLFGIWHVTRVLPSRATRNDFAHYYISSRLLLAGADVYATPLEPECARWGFQYSAAIPTATNPPFLVGIFAPFAALPPRAAFWAWTLFEVICLGYVLIQVWRATTSTLSARARRLVCGAIIASAPVYWHFVFSQSQLLIAGLILLAYRLLRNEKPERACLVLGTAAWLKFFPVVLLPWFLWRARSQGNRRWKCVGVIAAWSIAIVVATGWGSWREFWVHARPVLEAWIAQQRHFDFTVSSFVKNAAWAFHAFDLGWDGLQTWVTIGTVTGSALIALAYGLCWWVGRGRPDVDMDLEFCLLNVAMLAGIAESWGHYFVILAFPAAIAVSRAVRQPTSGRPAILAVALMMMNVMTSWQSPWLEFVISYLPLYGLLLLGVFFAQEIFRAPRPAADSTTPAPPPW